MAKVKVILFIDTNCYLDLYRLNDGKRLLESLKAQQNYIFVTEQVVNEVNRRKAGIVRDLLVAMKKTTLAFSPLPIQVLEIDESKNSKWKTDKSAIEKKAQQLDEEYKAEARKALEQVVKSEDLFSKTLKPIFEKQAKAKAAEKLRAKERKELGNPPGKREDPIGDQLTWEQLLSRAEDAHNLWIITRDSDFLIEFDETAYLNAFLYQELIGKNAKIEVHCFTSLSKGLQHFTKEITGKDIMPAEDLDKLQKEEKVLRFIDQSNAVGGPQYPYRTGLSSGSGIIGVGPSGPIIAPGIYSSGVPLPPGLISGQTVLHFGPQGPQGSLFSALMDPTPRGFLDSPDPTPRGFQDVSPAGSQGVPSSLLDVKYEPKTEEARGFQSAGPIGTPPPQEEPKPELPSAGPQGSQSLPGKPKRDK